MSRSPARFKNFKSHRPDIVLLLMVLALLVFGAIMVYDASIVSATRDFGDKYYYVKEQLKWIGIGLIGLFITMRIDYHFYRRLALPIFLSSLVLLVLVFAPVIGFEAYGAHRWLNLRLFTLQPSELIKITLAIFLAAWLENKQELDSFKHGMLPLLVILGVIGALVMREPDLGTLIIITGMAIAVYFAAGAKLHYYLVGIPTVLMAGLAVILISPYRRARLFTFLDPTSDPQGASYHINQVILALGSGGLFGTGIGQGRGKYEYLPEVTTDSIFAVIGEELGFIGSVLVIGFLSALIYRCFKVVRSAPDRFGELLALGIVCVIAIQVTLNLAAMVALVPLTGIPLPFISYGGSSLVVSLMGMGILLNISSQR